MWTAHLEEDGLQTLQVVVFMAVQNCSFLAWRGHWRDAESRRLT